MAAFPFGGMSEIPTLPPSVMSALCLTGGGDDMPPPPAPPKLTWLKGIVTRRQFYSSKVFFFDVRPFGGEEPGGDCGEDDDGAAKRGGGRAEGGDVGDGGRRSEKEPLFAGMYKSGGRHEKGGGPAGVLRAIDVVRISKEFDMWDVVEVGYMQDEVSRGGGNRSFEVYTLRVVSKGGSLGAGSMCENPRAPVYAGGMRKAHPDAGNTPSSGVTRGSGDGDAAEHQPLSKTAHARAPKGEICKFYLNSKRCPLERCILKHITDEVERRAAIAVFKGERRRSREELQLKTGRQFGEQEGQGGGKVHKKNRGRIFVKWIIDHVGKERLCCGTGVLDVAGGKGELADLMRGEGIPCTTIDPRGEAGGHGAAGGASQSNEQIAASFDKALWEGAEYADLLAGASMVMAMHPDQATEPAIDFAIARGKIFAVVPCCVFGRENDFRLSNTGDGGFEGDLVVTYEQYLQYLSEKSTSIRTDFLGFRGRDVVLHTLR